MRMRRSRLEKKMLVLHLIRTNYNPYGVPEEGCKLTWLMGRANISANVLSPILEELEALGLITEKRETHARWFIITEKGRKISETYDHLMTSLQTNT